MGSGMRKERGDTDEEDVPALRDKPPPGVLREIDEDGKEKIVIDHSTSAGITFQNTLMYELDWQLKANIFVLCVISFKCKWYQLKSH